MNKGNVAKIQDINKELLASLADVARQAAISAGQTLLDSFRSDSYSNLEASATRKTSGTDLATEADKSAEDTLRKVVSSLRPNDAILGEEGGMTKGSSGLVWVIDPLDGTTNFVYGFPAWSVSVAVALLEHDGHTSTVAEFANQAIHPALGSSQTHGTTLVGIVHDPLHDETFEATIGNGSTLNRRSITVRSANSLGEALVGTGFSYSASRRGRQGDMLRSVLPNVRDIRRAGSAALDLCSIANGRLDAYYEAGLKPWDAAAGLLIATEAGALAGEIDFDDHCQTLVVGSPAVYDSLFNLLVTAHGER